MVAYYFPDASAKAVQVITKKAMFERTYGSRNERQTRGECTSGNLLEAE
jgi:hypothetical protein